MWQQQHEKNKEQDRYKQNEIGEREQERQCGRFLKFLIIIAILFPSSKSLFVAHFYLWSFVHSLSSSTFCFTLTGGS
jgi:hypothetical protein